MEFHKVASITKNGGNFLFLRRTVAAILCFLSICVNTMQRMNLSFAIVDMVNSTGIDRGHKENNFTTMDCPAPISNGSNQPLATGEFFWDPELQGYILGSTYIGGVIGQLPGGIIAAKFGSKAVMVSALLISSICNLLSPTAAKINPYLFIILHALKGLAQGVVVVCTSVLISNWFPRRERGLAGTFINSGFAMGAFLCCLGAGSICALDFWNGWPLVFYIFGLLGVFVAVLILLFYNNLPEEDPWITDDELKYIQDGQDRKSFKNRPQTPWIAIITSKSIYFMTLAIIGQRWIVYYFLIANPLYFGTVLNLPIKQNGFLSAGPYLLQAAAGWMSSYFSLRMNHHMKIGTSRKFFNSLCTLIFCAGLIGMCLAKCNVTWNVVWLYIGTASAGFSFAGVIITAVDISPTFCGPLYGLTHSIGNISGFLVPLMVGKLTKGAQNLIQWERIFQISCGVAFGCNLIWVIFGSTKVEPWDPMSKKPKVKESNQEEVALKEEINSTNVLS